MDLLIPAEGTIIWTLLVFLILVFLLGKFAWKPILSAVNERDTNIVNALNQASLARQELEELKIENKKIIKEAKAERDSILKEALEAKEKIVAEAKNAARMEGNKMIDIAKQSIKEERSAAIEDIKLQLGGISVSIAEAILREKLEKTEAQDKLVENLIGKANFN